MKDYRLVGGPYNGKMISLPEDQSEYYVADIGSGKKHRYVKTEVTNRVAGVGFAEEFVWDQIHGGLKNSADAVTEAKSQHRPNA